MTFSDGKVIQTTWVNGRMHGEGTTTDPHGKKSDATYFNDLEIRLSDQNPDCFQSAYLNLIFVIIFWACIVTYSQGENGLAIMGAILFYLIMLCETCCSKTKKFLDTIESADRITELINFIK
jgi:hypothetical protein